MNENNNGTATEGYLFHHLLAMFQGLALQQLGKLMNPISGKLERDLQQARITIDMIEMIKKKTEGNLTDDEQRVIDSILMDLQMNYVDEAGREEKVEEEEEDRSAEPKVVEEDKDTKDEDEPEKDDPAGDMS